MLSSEYSGLMAAVSFTPLQQAMYSASVSDRATVSCFCVHQSTMLSPTGVMQALWDFPVVSTGSLYDAST